MSAKSRSQPIKMAMGNNPAIGNAAAVLISELAKPNDLEILYVSIDKLREYDDSPRARAHNKKALEQGQNVAGGAWPDCPHRHRRDWREQVRVIIVANRDPAALKAIRLALNRLPQDATWDDEKLRAPRSRR